MKITLPKIANRDILFFVSYGTYLVFSIISTSFYAVNFSSSYNYIYLACLLVLPLNEMINNASYTKKTMTEMAIIFMVAILLYFSSSRVIPIVCVLLFVCFGRNISFNIIARFTVLVSSPLILFIIASSLIGIIPNYLTISGSGRIRYYLGFLYALYLPAYAFNISALITYYQGRKIKWRTLFLLVLVNYAVYAGTNSRLSFYLALLVLFVSAFIKIKPRVSVTKKVVTKALILSYIICCISSLYLTISYDGAVKWKSNLNAFLGRRLSLGQGTLLQYGFGFFGQKITLIGSGLNAFGERVVGNYNFVDNLYLQALINYGVVFLLLYLILHTVALYRCYQKKDDFMFIMLAIIALHGTVDDLVLRLHYNTFWFVIGALVLGKYCKGEIASDKE